MDKFKVGDKVWVYDTVKAVASLEPSVLTENGVWVSAWKVRSAKNSMPPVLGAPYRLEDNPAPAAAPAPTDAQLRSELAYERALVDDYERNYVLPTFTWAEEYGIDLQKLVMDNAGKNCVELLVRALAAQPAPARPDEAVNQKIPLDECLVDYRIENGEVTMRFEDGTVLKFSAPAPARPESCCSICGKQGVTEQDSHGPCGLREGDNDKV